MIHLINVKVAVEYGVNAALIFNNIGYWVEKNRANNTNQRDGKTWTYNSIKAFSEIFPYLTKRQIELAIEKLEEGGVIETGCFNTDPKNRTKWYALTDKGWELLEKTPERGNAFHADVKSDFTLRGNAFHADVKSSYTDINNTYINTYICTPAEIAKYGFSEPLASAVKNWLAYKKEKRQSYKETGLRQLLNKIRKEADKHGDDAVIEVIESSMSSNYQGILWDRIKDRKKSGSAYIDAINNRYDVVDEWRRQNGES